MDITEKRQVLNLLTLQLETVMAAHGCRSPLVEVRIIDTDVPEPFVQFSLSGQILLKDFTP